MNKYCNIVDLFYNADMAMGKRKDQEQQEEMWIPQASLAKGASHPFYQRLNKLLKEAISTSSLEGAVPAVLCAERRGRPSLGPETYFRLLLIGYFEGIDSERGIAWGATTVLFDDVDGAQIAGLASTAISGAMPIVSLANSRNISITNSVAPAGTEEFVGVSGRDSNKIVLANDDLRGAREPYQAGSDVPPHAVTVTGAPRSD